MATAAGERLEWLVVGALIAGTAGWQAACRGGDDTGPSESGSAVAAALADFWPHALEPALADARAAAEALAAACAAWDAAASTAGAAATAEQAAAQGAFEAAFDAWQRVEVMRVGPLASSLTAVGGADLRDEVYSWPVVNACRVDQETVEADWASADFFEANLVNVYGFDALEVLLYGGAGNACATQVDINADGSWAALGADGVARNRASYAAAVSARIVADVTTIQDAWSPTGGDFAGSLAGAGGSASDYETDISGLNAIFDAAFLAETLVKDEKIGWQSGETDCGLDDCGTLAEALLAGRSHHAVVANLVGFRAVFSGGDAGGLDDVLASVGREDLAADLLTALDGADAAAAGLSSPLEGASQAELDALYTAVKAATDLLKGDVATVLGLEIPSEAAGDVD